MKFSEFDASTWPSLSPYLDTCLLPVTGLRGTETPDEMTDKAAAAGAWLSPVEMAFKGRTVTLPAHHYYDGSTQSEEQLKMLCRRFRQIGFRYVVLVCGISGLLNDFQGADLILQPMAEEDQPDPEALSKMIIAMWKANESANGRDISGGFN